jgi:hypothetical protein
MKRQSTLIDDSSTHYSQEAWLRGVSVESGDRKQGAANGGQINILNAKL